MSDDNTRRHWHGTPGDRYQQTNVWMQGGAKARSPRAAWAMPETDPTRRVCHLPLFFSFFYLSWFLFASYHLSHLLYYIYHFAILVSSKSHNPTSNWIIPYHYPTATQLTTMKDSNISTSSNGNKQSEGTSTFPTVNDRRRSSSTGSSNGLFSTLQSQKRESTNPELASRRASWNEQAAPGGFFSKWWDGYTRGNAPK